MVLNPGDVLYLPPLWYHHVEALDVSIAVNFWSFSNQSDFIREAIKKTTPLHKGITDKKRLAMYVKILIDMMVLEVTGQPASRYVQNLLKTRYQHLFEAGELPDASHFTTFCELDVISR